MSEHTIAGDLSDSVQHAGGERADMFDRERETSWLESLQNELDEVSAAMARLDEGTYGRCEVCRQPIGDERLEALPAIRFCVEHDRTSFAPAQD